MVIHLIIKSMFKPAKIIIQNSFVNRRLVLILVFHKEIQN